MPDAQKEAEFRDAMFQLKMPRETRIAGPACSKKKT
jgi:hypothetical protein